MFARAPPKLEGLFGIVSRTTSEPFGIYEVNVSPTAGMTASYPQDCRLYLADRFRERGSVCLFLFNPHTSTGHFLAPRLLRLPRFFLPDHFSQGFVALAAGGSLLSPLRLGLDRVNPAPDLRSAQPVALVPDGSASGAKRDRV